MIAVRRHEEIARRESSNRLRVPPPVRPWREDYLLWMRCGPTPSPVVLSHHGFRFLAPYKVRSRPEPGSHRSPQPCRILRWLRLLAVPLPPAVCQVTRRELLQAGLQKYAAPAG